MSIESLAKSLRCLCIALLLALHLLQTTACITLCHPEAWSRAGSPEEFLSVHFIQLAHDVFDRVFQSGYHDMFDSIDSPIRCSDDLIEDHECSLEGGKLDQRLDCFRIDLLRP